MSLAENERRFQELPRCEMQDINGGAIGPAIQTEIVAKVMWWLAQSMITVV